MKTLLTRVNTVTGLTYADDPTIMGALLACRSFILSSQRCSCV